MKLSIITVNLNDAEGLERTIESVINQTFTDYEYLVIDGGSSDKSTLILQKYSDKINYWISEPDNGIYSAMNKGLSIAQGEYCLFLNSNDKLLNNLVIDNVFHSNPNEDILYGDRYIVQDGVEEYSDYPDENNISFRYLMNTALCHQSMFIKRSLFKKIGQYNEGLIFASDWEFYMLAFFNFNASYRKINMPIVAFDLNGISNNKKLWDDIIIERELILRKHFRHILIEIERYNMLYNLPHLKLYRRIKVLLRTRKRR